jgi:hypothetical protein
LVTALALVAFNFYNNSSKEALSDVVKANIEALAEPLGGGGEDNSSDFNGGDDGGGNVSSSTAYTSQIYNQGGTKRYKNGTVCELKIMKNPLTPNGTCSF